MAQAPSSGLSDRYLAYIYCFVRNNFRDDFFGTTKKHTAVAKNKHAPMLLIPSIYSRTALQYE